MNQPTVASVSPFIRLFGRYLREQGLPVTQQREAVAEVVFSSEAHLSVEEIEHRLRGAGERIGKATVYRTLDLLVKSKLVEEHDFNEGFKRYEHRLSRQPEHEHLICLECGQVMEFKSQEIQNIKERDSGGPRIPSDPSSARDLWTVRVLPGRWGRASKGRSDLSHPVALR